MKFTVVDDIPFPREQVFRTHRDRLEELVAYMPNVESVVTEEREEDGEIVRLVNAWRAAQSEIPTIARPFIKPDMLSWIDRAEWDEDEYAVDWETSLGFLPDAIECRGRSEFIDYGDETQMQIEGEIVVDGSKIPGVPRLMAGKLAKALEGFVVNLVKPNFTETNAIVARYLEEQG